MLNARDHLFGISELAQDLACFLGVKFFQTFAPLKIADASHGVGITGNLPAAQVLATRCQTQCLGSLRAKTEDPIGEPLRVYQLSRLLNSIHVFPIWIVRILLVKTG